MHVLNESAASLYKTRCNITLTLIVVRITCDIYVFGLRMLLWRIFWLQYCVKELSYVCKGDTASDYWR